MNSLSLAQTAVLFVMFRRADLAERSFAAVRSARPARLYLAADGPRSHVPGEADLCARTRTTVDAMIDWPCAVHRDYAAQNLGAGKRVAQAIDWAFLSEERLIILEDDCLADPTFFRFCDELLERYAYDERVAMISGDQFVPGDWTGGGTSYAFARLTQIWGWATWKRAWLNYDFEMKAWPAEKRAGLLQRTFRKRRDQQYWAEKLDEALTVDCWDYQWCFTRWRLGQAGIVPSRNLVSNLGFRSDATHTFHPRHPASSRALAPMNFPLRHPTAVAFDDQLDARTARILFSQEPVWLQQTRNLYRGLRRRVLGQ
jgi:hypothetical protein